MHIDLTILIQILLASVALAVAVMTYVLGARAQMSGIAHVQSVQSGLQHEIDLLRDDLQQCHRERDALQRENILLLRELRRDSRGGDRGVDVQA